MQPSTPSRRPRPQRIFHLVAGAVVRALTVAALGSGVATAYADSLTYSTSLTLTNPVTAIASPVEYFMEHAGDFYVPTIDTAKFTITNATFKLTGGMGGAVWGGDADTQINAGIFTSAEVWFYSDTHTTSEISHINSLGFSTRYSAITIPAGQMPAKELFQSGSILDEGGYAKVRAKFKTWSNGSLTYYNTNTGVFQPLNAGIFGFMQNFRLEVRFDLQTVGTNASVTNLPPSSPTAPEQVETRYTLGSRSIPLPPTSGVPDEVQSIVALKAAHPQINGSDVLLNWNTSAGKTNYVQVSPDLTGAGGFADISGPLVFPGTNQMVTGSYVDLGGATNTARSYRVRILP